METVAEKRRRRVWMVALVRAEIATASWIEVLDRVDAMKSKIVHRRLVESLLRKCVL